MDKAIKKIQKKFIFTACAISFSIIALMVIILNLIMNLTYRNENQIITDMIYQTAAVNSSVNLETFELSEMKKSGDNYVLPVNINNVSRIILYGKISHKNPDTSWYCCGGGIMFNFQKSDGKIIGVHKEYMFNKDNTSVNIDFSDFNDVMYGTDYISLNGGKVIGDNIIISPVWWAASETSEDDKENISLELNSVTVIYKNGVNPADSDGFNIRYKNFNDVFSDSFPEILNTVNCFYIITDNDYNPIEINTGNFINEIDNSEYSEITEKIKNSDSSTGSVSSKNGMSFNYKIKSEKNTKIIVFIHNSSENKTLKQLLLISSGVGFILTVVLFFIILIVSKNVTNPVRIAFEKQKEFISNASHELKTPVTVISATADLIKNQTGENRWINSIKEQSEKMGRLVNELLTLARISEINEQYKKFIPFDISKTINNSVLYFECQAYEENKTIRYNIQENLTFNGEENKISELINILIDNALKYSPENTEININFYKSKNKFYIECSNQCANPESFDVKRIFERFYRNNKIQTENKSGFGLGLSIAQSIAEYHSGNIGAELNGNIIKFTVILPEQ